MFAEEVGDEVGGHEVVGEIIHSQAFERRFHRREPRGGPVKAQKAPKAVADRERADPGIRYLGGVQMVLFFGGASLDLSWMKPQGCRSVSATNEMRSESTTRFGDCKLIGKEFGAALNQAYKTEYPIEAGVLLRS